MPPPMLFSFHGGDVGPWRVRGFTSNERYVEYPPAATGAFEVLVSRLRTTDE